MRARIAAVFVLVAAFLVAIFGPSVSAPSTGISVPSLSDFNALEQRVTDLEQRPTPTVTATTTVTNTPTSSPTSTPTTPSPTTTPTAQPGVWPSAANTGVPAGTTLTPYTGSLRVTAAGTTIDAKRITGTLTIAAANVTVTRSSITGTVVVASGSLTITDTDIDAGQREGTGLGDRNYAATRVHIVGGNRSAYCVTTCTIQQSYVHGQFRDATGKAHESGIRMEQNTTLIGNTILCDAPDVPPDAGCSASLTGYGDFAAVRDNLIQGNYFPASTGGACAYGGSSAGKPFSSSVRNVRFMDNVFERRASSERGTTCGYYFTIADWDGTRPGNVWTGNKYTDGTTVAP